MLSLSQRTGRNHSILLSLMVTTPWVESTEFLFFILFKETISYLLRGWSPTLGAPVKGVSVSHISGLWALWFKLLPLWAMNFCPISFEVSCLFRVFAQTQKKQTAGQLKQQVLDARYSERVEEACVCSLPSCSIGLHYSLVLCRWNEPWVQSLFLASSLKSL